MVGSGWKRENPATGYDHRITASTFLPFYGVFPSELARTLSPGYVEKKVDFMKCHRFLFIQYLDCLAENVRAF
jgi:hypothetical protein